MGREVRRVPANWQHPKEDNWRGESRYKPLYEGYANAKKEFLQMLNEKGLQEALDYYGQPPDQGDYMPDWPEDQRTHYQMYETCSEGTPISPVMESPEALAHWLADNDASSFGSMTATYEEWLRVCRGGWACSAVISDGVIESGVSGLSKIK